MVAVDVDQGRDLRSEQGLAPTTLFPSPLRPRGCLEKRVRVRGHRIWHRPPRLPPPSLPPALLPLPSSSQCEAEQCLGAFRALTCRATTRSPLCLLLLHLSRRKRLPACSTAPSKPMWQRSEAARGEVAEDQQHKDFLSVAEANRLPGCSRRCADYWNTAPFCSEHGS
jgi:hypothetical protein